MHRILACLAPICLAPIWLAPACAATPRAQVQTAAEAPLDTSGAPELHADVRVVEFPTPMLDELLPELRDREFIAALGDERVAALLERGTLLAESRIPLWDRCTGSVSIRSQRAYVADFEVSETAAGSVANPVSATFDAGFDLALRASRGPERDGALALEAELAWTRIIAMEKFTTTAGRSIEPVTVELPQWRVAAAEVAASVRPGEWLAVGRPVDDAPTLVAFIRVE